MERRDFLGCAMLATLGAGTALAQATSETTTKSEPAKMPEAAKGLRITVLKCSVQQDFQKYRKAEIKPCDLMKEGQQFTIEQPWTKPAGMCDWAWADMRAILPYVYSGMWEQNVTCCSDGSRPVFFRIERLT
jgi:uncharacterized repeat protein (TIGR04076 family)